MNLEELYTTQASALEGYARRLIGGEEEVADICYHTWESMVRKWDRLSSHPNLPALLRKIAKDRAAYLHRTRKQEQVTLDDWDTAWSPSAEDAYLSEFEYERAYQAIAQLSPAVREVMELVILEHTSREIAEILGCSYQSVRTRISRGRADLRGFYI